MLLKNILAAFTIAGLAAASPAGDIEARSSTSCATGTPFCCATAFPLSIFFIQGVGSNCQTGKAILSSFRENSILIGHPRHCDGWSFIMYWYWPHCAPLLWLKEPDSGESRLPLYSKREKN
jgi:hypothetical protein